MEQGFFRDFISHLQSNFFWSGVFDLPDQGL